MDGLLGPLEFVPLRRVPVIVEQQHVKIFRELHDNPNSIRKAVAMIMFSLQITENNLGT